MAFVARFRKSGSTVFREVKLTSSAAVTAGDIVLIDAGANTWAKATANPIVGTRQLAVVTKGNTAAGSFYAILLDEDIVWEADAPSNLISGIAARPPWQVNGSTVAIVATLATAGNQLAAYWYEDGPNTGKILVTFNIPDVAA